jgi:PncC family amidohydrolase
MEIQEVADILLREQKTVSVAEACTCGLVGYLLGTVPGASQFFPGGVIAYTGGLKQRVLGVTDELYAEKGSVSREMAIAMAQGVRELVGTDFGISTTGVTGPAAGRSGLPIGTFWVGMAVKGGVDTAIEIRVGGDRDDTKHGAVQAAINLLGNRLAAGR